MIVKYLKYLKLFYARFCPLKPAIVCIGFRLKIIQNVKQILDDFALSLWAQKVSGAYEKRAPDYLTIFLATFMSFNPWSPPFFLTIDLLQLDPILKR